MNIRLLALILWIATANAQAPKRDLSGVWGFEPSRQVVSADDTQSPGGEIPALTAWAKARYDLQKPGYGKRAAPGQLCWPGQWSRPTVLSILPNA